MGKYNGDIRIDNVRCTYINDVNFLRAELSKVQQGIDELKKHLQSVPDDDYVELKKMRKRFTFLDTLSDNILQRIKVKTYEICN